MINFLKESYFVDFSNPDIQKLAKQLSNNTQSDEEISKNCFIYVRDKIHHSGDYKDDITT